MVITLFVVKQRKKIFIQRFYTKTINYFLPLSYIGTPNVTDPIPLQLLELINFIFQLNAQKITAINILTNVEQLIYLYFT